MTQQVKKQQNKKNTVKKWNWRVTLAAVVAGLLAGSVIYLMVDKFLLHQVVCQFLGINEENGLIALKCMIR